MQEVAGSSPAATTIDFQPLPRQVISPCSQIVHVLSLFFRPTVSVEPTAEFPYAGESRRFDVIAMGQGAFLPARVANHSRVQIDDVFIAF